MPKADTLVLCHNDLAFNMLEDKGGRLWAIDFECAGWNMPIFDLAFLCIWYEFSDEEKQDLLSCYGKGETLDALNRAMVLGMLFSALWSKLEVAYGNDRYQKQAQDLFEKALFHRKK
jgi:thiamine kinase-like enzyme